MNKTLDQIGTEEECDKSRSIGCGHGYLDLYERLFERLRNDHLRDEPVSILEIGVFLGRSLRTWDRWFENAAILGLDVTPDCAALRLPPNISVKIRNAYTMETVTELRNHPQYDIIIDDGSHVPADQTFFVANYAPLLSPRGILIVEDIGFMGGDLETAKELRRALPKNFASCVTIFPKEKGAWPDSILFIAWRV